MGGVGRRVDPELLESASRVIEPRPDHETLPLGEADVVAHHDGQGEAEERPERE